jgi:hypothetical protein
MQNESLEYRVLTQSSRSTDIEESLESPVGSGPGKGTDAVGARGSPQPLGLVRRQIVHMFAATGCLWRMPVDPAFA